MVQPDRASGHSPKPPPGGRPWACLRNVVLPNEPRELFAPRSQLRAPSRCSRSVGSAVRGDPSAPPRSGRGTPQRLRTVGSIKRVGLAASVPGSRACPPDGSEPHSGVGKSRDSLATEAPESRSLRSGVVRHPGRRAAASAWRTKLTQNPERTRVPLRLLLPEGSSITWRTGVRKQAFRSEPARKDYRVSLGD